MKAKLLLTSFFLLFGFMSNAQWYVQYFDGADTSAQNSVIITIDPDTIGTDTINIWQVGPPQKTLFNAASTVPNVLVTDTVNFYPPNDTSSFSFIINPSNWGSNVLALQWKQKLDYDTAKDGGVIEFSIDSGQTWQNAFTSPYVYNFYGYNTINEDTIYTGEKAFTGRDTLWRDIWLCYDLSWLNFNPGLIHIRFTSYSDSIDNSKEGWMIDNLSVHPTWIHTISEKQQEEYMLVYPSPTDGIVNISTKKIDGMHIIENMQLVSVDGKVVQQWNNVPTKFFIDIGNHANGLYHLKVKTNIQEQTFPLILNKK